MLIAMIALAGLAGVGTLTLLITNSGQRAASHDRFQSIALHAAESGAAAGMSYLRSQHITGTHWTELVTPSNETISFPVGIAGNTVKPGETGGVLSADLNAWYEVSLLNNVADPGYATGLDSDGRIVIRSIGHGPNDTTVIIEVEVSAAGLAQMRGRCGAYGQQGLGEDGAGRNDCLGSVDATTATTYQPGE